MEIGIRLRDQELAERKRNLRIAEQLVGRRRENEPLRHLFALEAALIKHAGGDPAPLVAFLRSDALLPGRETLAWLVEQAAQIVANRRPKDGRPIDKLVWFAAHQARTFYSHWKGCLRQNGIRIRGHANEMKNFSCQCVVDSLPEDWGPPSVAEVRDHMDRPQSRRPESVF